VLSRWGCVGNERLFYPVHEPDDHIGDIDPEDACKREDLRLAWRERMEELRLTLRSTRPTESRPLSAGDSGGWRDFPKLSTAPSRTG
jgi:hypothetical protein